MHINSIRNGELVTVLRLFSVTILLNNDASETLGEAALAYRDFNGHFGWGNTFFPRASFGGDGQWKLDRFTDRPDNAEPNDPRPYGEFAHVRYYNSVENFVYALCEKDGWEIIERIAVQYRILQADSPDGFNRWEAVRMALYPANGLVEHWTLYPLADSLAVEWKD